MNIPHAPFICFLSGASWYCGRVKREMAEYHHGSLSFCHLSVMSFSLTFHWPKKSRCPSPSSRSQEVNASLKNRLGVSCRDYFHNNITNEPERPYPKSGMGLTAHFSLDWPRFLLQANYLLTKLNISPLPFWFNYTFQALISTMYCLISEYFWLLKHLSI